MFVAQQIEADFLTKELLQQLGGAFWIGLDRLRNQRDQLLDILSVTANVYDSSTPPVLKAGPLRLDIEAAGTQPPTQQAGYLLQTGPGLALTAADVYRVVYAVRLRTGEVKTIQQSFVLRDDPYGPFKQLLCCPDVVPPITYTPWPMTFFEPGGNRVLSSNGLSMSDSWSYTGGTDEYFAGTPILDNAGNVYLRSTNFDTHDTLLYKFDKDGNVTWSVNITADFDGTTVIIPQGGVAIDDLGNIFVTCRGDNIACYSAVDGSKTWSYDTTTDGVTGGHALRSAPVVDVDGKVHICTGRDLLADGEVWAYRFNADGTVNWKFKIWDYNGDGILGPSSGAAAIAGDHVYYVSHGITTGKTRVQSLNRLTGASEWITTLAELGTDYSEAQVGAVVSNGTFYELWPINKVSPSGNSERTAWGLISDLAAGTDSMTNGLGGYGAFWSLPVVDSDGNVYAASKYDIPTWGSKGRLTKYNSSGAEQWHFAGTVDGESIFPPILCADCLIVPAGGDNAFPAVSLGHVYFLNPADGSLLNTLSYAAAGTETTHGIGSSGVSLNGQALYVAMGRTLHVYSTV